MRRNLLARLERTVGDMATRRVFDPTKGAPVKDPDSGQVFSGKLPSMALPENVNDLLDQRRERLAGGNKLVRRNDIMRWIAPTFRAQVLSALDKMSERAGEISPDVKGAVDAVREAAGGKKTVLSDADMKKLEELWRQARAMSIVDTLPQHSAQLGGEVAQFSLHILSHYGIEAFPEFELMTHLAGDLMVPLMQWQVAHGYVMDLEKWDEKGRPFLGRQAPAGVVPWASQIVAQRDPEGNDVPLEGPWAATPPVAEAAVAGLHDKQGILSVPRKDNGPVPAAPAWSKTGAITTEVAPGARLAADIPATAPLPSTLEEHRRQGGGT